MKIQEGNITEQEKENLILLLNRLRNISDFQNDEWRAKRTIHLIEATGFELHIKKYNR